MNLQLAHVEMVIGGAVLLSGAVFMVDSWGRRRDTSDRLWALAFMAVVCASLAGIFWDLYPTVWALAIHHASLVAGVNAVWSGARAAEGRRPLAGLGLVLAVPAGLAVVALGEHAPYHANLPVLLILVIAAAGGTGMLIAQGSLRARRGGPLLGIAMSSLGLYSLFRLAVYLTAGPESEAFSRMAGTAGAAFVTGISFIAAGFGMVMLRSAHAPAVGTVRFDWLTGARLPSTFTRRAEQLIAEADRMGQSVCVVRIEPEDVAAIDIAYGRGAGAEALAAVGEAAAMLEPPGSVLGLTPTRGFELLLPTMPVGDVREWAGCLRKALIDTPLDVTGGRLRLTISVGIASASVHGYSLSALRAAAESAVDEALSAGGNRIRVADAPLGGRS